MPRPRAALAAERYAMLVEAVDMATRVDELVAFRNEIRRNYVPDYWTAHLELMIDAKVAELLGQLGVDDDED